MKQSGLQIMVSTMWFHTNALFQTYYYIDDTLD